MSIALEMKVQGLESRLERLEDTLQQLLERAVTLESELEALKSLPALATDVPRGTNTNGRAQKK